LSRLLRVGEQRDAQRADRDGGRGAPARLADDPVPIALQRTQRHVEIRQPLVLISQIQRSGGTLLSQLLDGCPELHTHPHELHTGHPRKFNWPQLPLEAGPEACFELLYERPFERFMEHGYRKEFRPGVEAVESLPFVFSPAAQRRIFLARAKEWGATARGLFDAYMTAFFNAWLDNQNLYAVPKRWVAAFVPMLSMHPESVEGFFCTYPDGRLVSVIRDPRSWYVSAHGHYGKRAQRDFATVESAMDHWRRSTEASLDARERYGDRVRLVTFEALVGDTEATMRTLADYLNIGFGSELLQPTFNTMPILANSSFDVREHGVRREAIKRFRGRIADDDLAYIARHSMALYEQALGVCARPTTPTTDLQRG
jgi:hypothetical protein